MDNGLRIDFKDMARVVGETWRTLTSKEKAPYEVEARGEMAQYEREKKKYEEKHKIWADLHHKAKASGQLQKLIAFESLHSLRRMQSGPMPIRPVIH